MANLVRTSSAFFFCLALLSTPPTTVHAHGHAAEGGGGGGSTPFESMYAWGDSLTDTGNFLLYYLTINASSQLPEGQLPYGQTFFHYPTGRYSDGRVLLDFLAQQVKAPHFLLPYLGLNGTQSALVNFAVGGASAQSVEYLKATYNISYPIPFSLERQIQWFSTLSISKDKEAFSKALVYFGEIGVNDYRYALAIGFSTNDIITTFVPVIMKVIQNTLEFLINSGAKYLVIEGGYPFGCTLYARSLFTNATRDQYGCVEELQRLNKVHDKLLKELVYNLTTKYNQDVHFILFDQLKAYTQLLMHPSHYGFTNTIDPCFDDVNSSNVEVCSSPSTYLSWDGIHFTEAANSALFNLFRTRGFVTPYPNFLTSNSF